MIILCYHKVDPRREWGVTRLSPRTFRRQMEALAREGWRTVGSGDLARRLEAPPPDRPDRELVLTFDDGYAALAAHAFPVLADLGFTALVFVVTDYVGRDNDWDVHYGWRRFRHLSWDELAYWQGRGIEVHAHGASHARLTWLPDDRVRDEIGRARETILARLGVAPTGLAYPFGAVDARIRRLTAEAGYQLGFAGPSGMRPAAPSGPVPDPLALPRTPIYAWDRWGLPLELRGGVPGAAAAKAARLANRLSVLTTVFRRLSGVGP